MKSILLTFFLLCVPAFLFAKFPGKTSKWHGYELHDFQLHGVKCKVVEPANVACGKPWVWRARFWGHEPQTDKALLELGWHVVYCDVGNLFGNDKAVERWNMFYDYLVGEHKFSKKTVLEGMSRGGLIIYNWASANPEAVHCIYADAPVCDIRSWPGGKGKGKGSAGAWKTCMKAHGLTEETANDFKGNPIDYLEPLANAGVPLFHVVGQADVVVPVEENTDILEKRYKALGGKIEVIRKEGVGHHPHSLKDPKPIVDFILKHSEK